MAKALQEQGLKLVTTRRKNMKKVERSAFEGEFLRRRTLVETVIEHLENEFKIYPV